MPELPEVETVVRRLRPDMVGRTFTRVHVTWPRAVATGADQLRRALPGHQVTALERRGKFLLFELVGAMPGHAGRAEGGEPAGVLLIHLRMTGRLNVEAPGAAAGRLTRVAFELDDGRALHFDDARKFGRVFFVPRAEMVTGALGPEPLAEDFTLAAFRRLLAGRARQLKPLLLDQTFLAGLGNIYADEVLYRARLHPLRRTDTLSPEETRRLHRAIRDTLRRAIEHHGTSFDWAYAGGNYQELLNVYDRAGQPCPRCGTPVERTVVGQRGTYFCPECQVRLAR
jgi:formamidopyrimidine-DNA glycosylase